MLLEITIKNFAIIEEISLNFENGMTVLTGETGAGKSIIIDAMNMMLGARATTDVIRHGAPKAEIEGLFSVENSRLLQEIFDEQGLEFGDEIIIRRKMVGVLVVSMARWLICLFCVLLGNILWIFMVSMTKKS